MIALIDCWFDIWIWFIDFWQILISYLYSPIQYLMEFPLIFTICLGGFSIFLLLYMYEKFFLYGRLLGKV